MIYLVDTKLEEDSHSNIIGKIIDSIFQTEISVTEISASPTYGELYRVMTGLSLKVTPFDVILCPWAVDADYKLDSIFDSIASVCYIVVDAGNSGQSIDDYSPARSNSVITVGCLNKSGIKASCSNFSNNKPIEWVVGTSYASGNKVISGTSVSSAIYAALLSKSILLGLSVNAERDKYNNSLISRGYNVG